MTFLHLSFTRGFRRTLALLSFLVVGATAAAAVAARAWIAIVTFTARATFFFVGHWLVPHRNLFY